MHRLESHNSEDAGPYRLTAPADLYRDAPVEEVRSVVPSLVLPLLLIFDVHWLIQHFDP